MDYGTYTWVAWAIEVESMRLALNLKGFFLFLFAKKVATSADMMIDAESLMYKDFFNTVACPENQFR